MNWKYRDSPNITNRFYTFMDNGRFRDLERTPMFENSPYSLKTFNKVNTERYWAVLENNEVWKLDGDNSRCNVDESY